MKTSKKLLISVVALFALYLVIGFLVLPMVVRSQMLKHLPTVLDREVTLEKVRFNPLTLVLELEGLEVLDPDGTPFVSLEDFRVNLQASSLFRKGVVLKELRFGGPAIQMLREPDGSLNFEDLLEVSETEDPNGESGERALPVLRIGILAVEGGSIIIEDRSPSSNYLKEVRNISFVVNDLTTEPGKSGQFEILADSGNAEAFRWSGSVGLNPLDLKGEIVVEALDLPRFMPYVEHVLNGKLERGLLSLWLDYEISLGESGTVLAIHDGSVELDDFFLLTHDATDPMLAWNRLALSGLSADLEAKQVVLGEVTLEGTRVFAHRHSDGTLNMLTAYHRGGAEASPESTQTAPEEDGSPPADWNLSIGRIGISDTVLRFLDDSLATPAELTVKVPQVELANLSNQAKEAFNLNLSLENGTSGTATVAGMGTLVPMSGDYTLSVDNWDLTPLKPFLAEFTGMILRQGSLGMKGAIVYSVDEDGPSGDLAFESVQLLNPDLSFVLEPVPETPEPTEAEEATVEVSAVASTETDEEAPMESEEAPVEEAPVDSPFTAFIHTFSIVGGTFSFEDLGQDPNVVFSLEEINSQIEGLSSDLAARPTFTLDARAMGITPLAVNGQLNLLASQPYADVTVVLKGLEMNPFGPYISRYVGYHLDKGLLNLDLHYKVEENELEADNLVILNQFTLGQKTDSPDATGLPVTLAIGLLKDASGNIEVDLPIQGNLNDPEFRIGRVVMRALSTLIVKVASSPFNMLAGLVNMSADDLERATFAPGISELGSSAVDQLDALALAMEKRPGIQLEISAGIDPALETPALRRYLLQQKLKESVNLDETETMSDAAAYQARVRKAYRGENLLTSLVQELPPFQEMEASLLEPIQVGPNELRQLASRRKQAVRNYLLSKETIEPSRILISENESLDMTESGLSQVNLSIQ